MRATFARVALVLFVSTSLAGCSSMSKLAFWRKSDDKTKLADAPQYNGTTNSQLPSAGLNPSNSLASVPGYSTNNAAAAAAAAQAQAGGSSYAAAPASYQSSVYPTTPYNQAKLGTTASAGTSAAGPWAAGTTPSATSSYASTSPYAATGSASTPAYGTTASTAGGVQAQSGYYNPTYDGGTANRYVSGAAIPSSTTSTAVAGSTPVGSYSPNYRTADARSGMTSSTPIAGSYGATGQGTSATGVGSIPEVSAATSTSPGGGSAASIVGDRYANTTAGAPTSGASAYGSYSGGSSAYSPASGGAYSPASGGAYSPAASDYRSSASGYDSSSYAGQQTATAGSLGNTGYNPSNAYSTPGYSTSSGASGTSAWPARNDQEYRPGGTSNYSAPATQPAQPSTNGAGSDSRAQLGGVTPASYQAPDTSGGRVTATMVSPASGGSDYYGSYQGTGAASPASTPTSQPNRNW